MKNLFFFLLLLACNLYSQFWVEQVSGVSVSLNSVVNSNISSTAWICGNNGTVLRTTNDGVNWINVSGNGIPGDVNLNAVSDCGNMGGYAAVTGKRGDTAIVYRTTNSGASWQVVFRQLGGKVNGLSLGYDGIWTTGYIIGNPVGGRWSVWKSTNNGANWDSAGMFIPQNNSELGTNNTFNHVGTYIFFGTNNSRVYYTTNQGANWNFSVVPGLTNIVSLDLTFSFNPAWYTGYVGGLNKILFTSNGGTNWSQDTIMPGSGNIVGLHKQPVPVDMLGFYSIITTKGDNKIYWQAGGSNSWILHFTAPGGNYTHIATKVYNRVWAVRDNGGITFCGCNISGITGNPGEIPEKFSLNQNYPNPFNPVTNIKFELPKSGVVKMTIYDLLGREISQLVNQQMQPGSYSVDWDASNYPSGVYFYKLETDGFVESKKMVLIK